MSPSTAIKFLIGLIVLCTAVQVQARIFQKVEITKGMEARVVVSIIQDRQGYLWIGSREGAYSW